MAEDESGCGDGGRGGRRREECGAVGEHGLMGIVYGDFVSGMEVKGRGLGASLRAKWTQWASV